MIFAGQLLNNVNYFIIGFECVINDYDLEIIHVKYQYVQKRGKYGE